MQSIAANLLSKQITIMIPFPGITGFIGHVFTNKIAIKNECLKGNYFEKELGVSQLGLAFAGILSNWYKGYLWIAVIAIFCTMFFGAAIIHTYDLIKNKNFKKNNTGIIAIDLSIPASFLVLSIFLKIW